MITNFDVTMEAASLPMQDAIEDMTAEMAPMNLDAQPVVLENFNVRPENASTKIENAINELIAGTEVMNLIVVSLIS